MLAWIAALACVVSGVALLTVPASPPAGAETVKQRKQTVDQRVDDVRESLEGASKSLIRAAVKLERAQAKLVEARQRLVTERAALARAVARDAELASQLAYAQAQEQKARRELDAREQESRQTRAALGRVARSTYAGTQLSGLAVVLQSQTPQDFSDRLAVAEVAMRRQSAAVDRLAVEQAELRARGLTLAALRKQVDGLKQQSEEVVAARRAAEQAARASEARIERLVKAERAAVAVIKTKVAGERKRLRALRREQSRLRAVLRARERAARRDSGNRAPDPGPPAVRSGFLSAPTRGVVTSPFGRRFHPILRYWRLHSGTDIGAPCGRPVYAAADGRVLSSGRSGAYGNRIVLTHGLVRGTYLATTYSHMSRLLVSGGRVRRGQVIGQVGTTGASTGCHLHFETIANGTYVNPARWL